MWREVFFGEREIFTSFDQEQYYKAVQALREAGVKYHTKMMHTGGNTMRGGHNVGRMGENPRFMTQFMIYVKKADAERAAHALRGR